MARVIALAGGGTAGHVVPGLALAEAIRAAEPDASLCFVGTAGGQEEHLVPAAGYTLERVPSRAVLGRSPLGMVRALLTLLRGVHVARGLLRRLEVDLVVGTGGYASVPAMLAAVTLGIPTALIEPNAQPGRANRLLGRFARLVFVQFDDAVPFFPKGRARLLGFPVRDIPARHDEAARHDVRLLVMGGSQGARAINRALCAGLDRLSACERLRIAHQAGKLDLDEVREAYASAGLDAEIAPFFDDVPRRLASTDLVVSRAGASTIAELRMAGVASVLVPLPLADDHQLANARELERQGACALVRNDEADDRLVDEVLRLAADSAARRAMGEAAAARAEPESAARIWRACAALAEAKA